MLAGGPRALSMIAKAGLKLAEIIRNNGWLFTGSGLLTVVRLGAGLLLLKLVALLGGSAAIAIYGQAHNLASMINGLLASGAGVGVVKMTAQHQSNPRKISELKSASLVLTLISTAMTIAVVSIFWEIFIEWSSIGVPSPLQIMTFIAGALLASTGALLVSIANGLQHFSTVIKVNVTAVAVALIFAGAFLQFTQVSALTLVPAIYLGITGACQVAMLFAYIKSPPIIFKLPKLSVFKDLSGFALMAVGSFFMTPATLITVRGWLIAGYGAEAAGDWESSRKVLELITGLLTSYFAMVLIPKLAKVANSESLREKIYETALAVMALCLVAFAFLYTFKSQVFSVIFSADLRVTDEVLVSRALGECLRALVWVFGLILVVQAKTKLYLVTGLVYALMLLASSRLMIDAYGVVGANYAYAISNAIMLIISVILFESLTKHSRIGV